MENDDYEEFNGVSQRELSNNGMSDKNTTTMKDVFVAFANNNSSFMSSIEFFKLCKFFKIYPVSDIKSDLNAIGHDKSGDFTTGSHQGLSLLAYYTR